MFTKIFDRRKEGGGGGVANFFFKRGPSLTILAYLHYKYTLYRTFITGMS